MDQPFIISADPVPPKKSKKGIKIAVILITILIIFCCVFFSWNKASSKPVKRHIRHLVDQYHFGVTSFWGPAFSDVKFVNIIETNGSTPEKKVSRQEITVFLENVCPADYDGALDNLGSSYFIVIFKSSNNSFVELVDLKNFQGEIFGNDANSNFTFAMNENTKFSDLAFLLIECNKSSTSAVSCNNERIDFEKNAGEIIQNTLDLFIQDGNQQFNEYEIIMDIAKKLQMNLDETNSQFEANLTMFEPAIPVICQDAANPPLNKIDWATEHKVPIFKQKRGDNNCFIYAAIDAMHYSIQIDLGRYAEPILSINQVIKCSGSNRGCDGGSYNQVFSYMNDRGIGYASDFMDDTECDKIIPQFTAAKSIDVYGHIDHFKTCLHSGPLVIGIYVSRWDIWFRTYGTRIAENECDGNTPPNHAVIATGFEVREDGVLIFFKNSWGPRWGRNAMGRILVRPGKNPMCIFNIEARRIIAARI